MLAVVAALLSFVGSITVDAKAQLKPERVRISESVSQAFIAKKVDPVYPPDAKRKGIQGVVKLRAKISKEGDVTDLILISGDPALTPAATDAVKQWKYKPYLLNGEPIAVETQVSVAFELRVK
jgi:protein TonB